MEERKRPQSETNRDLYQRGLHKGKGPRSYQRSDVRIGEEIHDLLLNDSYVDASDVEVSVENGEVILTGMVEDRNSKRRVEDIIHAVAGVTQVENRLRAKRPAGPEVDIQNPKNR
jgi:osmotically-inducible protein OsmY